MRMRMERSYGSMQKQEQTTRCAAYLFGEKRARWYTWAFILTLVVFAVIPLEAAVGLCDLFYAFMAIPTMLTLIVLSSKVRAAAKDYFGNKNLSPKLQVK